MTESLTIDAITLMFGSITAVFFVLVVLWGILLLSGYVFGKEAINQKTAATVLVPKKNTEEIAGDEWEELIPVLLGIVINTELSEID